MDKVYKCSKEKKAEYNMRYYIKNRDTILKHQRERFYCKVCDKHLNLSNKSKHLKTSKHKWLDV